MEKDVMINKILQVFKNPSHTYRTSNGIATETGFSIKEVQDLLEANSALFIPRLKRTGKLEYISRERFEKMKIVKNQQDIGPIAEIAAEISETEPKEIQKFGSLIIELLNEYNKEILSQTKKSFKWALFAGIAGFAIFIVSISVLLISQQQSIGILGTVAGAIVEVISGLQFYLYGKTTVLLSNSYQRLDRNQRFLIANSICESLEGENKQKSRSELVKQIALSAQNIDERNIG